MRSRRRLPPPRHSPLQTGRGGRTAERYKLNLSGILVGIEPRADKPIAVRLLFPFACLFHGRYFTPPRSYDTSKNAPLLVVKMPKRSTDHTQYLFALSVKLERFDFMPTKQPSITVVEKPARPLFIYDGECNFCKFWILRWQRFTRGRVDYVASQEPQIARTDFRKFRRSDLTRRCNS